MDDYNHLNSVKKATSLFTAQLIMRVLVTPLNGEEKVFHVVSTRSALARQ